MNSPGESVLVVGAGVSGLTTAICLAEAGQRVRVWTAEPPQQTTSAVAGALWGPSFQEPMAKTMAWTEVSLGEFTALAADPDTGVRLAPAVVVGALPADGELPPQAQMIPELRPCTDEELPPGFESGFHSRMPLMDMPRYLDYLERRLVAAGGEIEQRNVRTLAEATEVTPIVAAVGSVPESWPTIPP